MLLKGETIVLISRKCWLKHVILWFNKDYSQNNKTIIEI